MLDLANNRIEAVNKFFQKMAIDPKYKYTSGTREAPLVYELQKDTWGGMTFVSYNNINSSIGTITVSYKREIDGADIIIANESENIWFMRDVLKVIEKLFMEQNIKKLLFSVMIGNPVEKAYDKFITKYGGSVVGIFKNHARNLSNEICDLKCYELFREDYVNVRKN